MTRYPLRVTHRVLESPDTVSLGFGVPQDLRHVFRHQPGQFVSLATDMDGQSLERSYSISSLPDIYPWLRITVKRLPAGSAVGRRQWHCTVGADRQAPQFRGNASSEPRLRPANRG